MAGEHLFGIFICQLNFVILTQLVLENLTLYQIVNMSFHLSLFTKNICNGDLTIYKIILQ